MASSEPPSGGLARLGHEIRRRNVIPWTLGYAAGGWIVLEATDYFGDLYGWPDVVDRVLPIVLAFGILSTIVLAWFHGAVGWQRVRPREIAIHAAIAALLLTTLGLWNGTVPGTAPDDTPPLTRIAVLYFKSNSPDVAGGDVAGDLTESVVHRLANVPALDVMPLTAVEAYRREGMPSLGDVVEELRVGALVEGSLTRTGDSVRIVAQLFEASDGSHLASWEVTESDEGGGRWVPVAAQAISDSVRSRLGREVERRRAEAGSTSPDALDLYRRARAIVEREAGVAIREDRRAGLALLREADALLRDAKRLDPAWPAPVILQSEIDARASRIEGGAGGREPHLMREAIAHATEALDLGGDSARLMELRGVLLFRMAGLAERAEASRLYGEAEQDLRSAVRLDPGRAEAWWALGQLHQQRGSAEAAYDFAVRAQERDSFLQLGPDAPLGLLLSALEQRRLAEARRWCDEGRRLYPLDQGIIQGCLMLLVSLEEPGEEDVEEAWVLTRSLGQAGVGMAERRPGWVALGQTAVAAVLAGRGQADSVRHVLQRARRVFREHEAVLGPGLIASGRSYEALAWLRLGRTDSALAALAEFVELRPAEAPRLASEWWFRELWDDPRYRALHTTPPTESAPGG